MSGGFLKRLEVDAVRSPVDHARIFVEFCGEIANVGRSGRRLGEDFVDVNDSDVAVDVIKVRRCERGREGELLPVWRENWATIGSFERDDFVDRIVVSKVGDVDVFFAAEREERIRCR